MMRLILHRLIQLPIILWVIYTLTFAMAWALPGSAVINDEGRKPPAAVLAAMERQYHLDSPARFYFEYLYGVSGLKWLVAQFSSSPSAPPRHVFDFGPSFRYEDWSVNELIASTLPVSIVLGFASIIIALAIGLTAGIVGALRPGSLADLATFSIALIGVSLPTFVVGTGLLLLFPLGLGIGTIGVWSPPASILLPAITLALPAAAYIARLTRMGMIDALGADYIRTARAKGAAPSSVILRHALKNAFLPVLSFLGPAAAYAMTGSFVVERVFNVPGIGQHFVAAVRNKDLFVIMGITLIYAAMLVVFNLIVDVLYRWVDPRIQDA